MYIKANKSTLFITKDRDIDSTPIIFIHGFTGSHKSWKAIRDKIKLPSISIDIPGHGKSTFHDLNEKYFFNDFTNELYLFIVKMGFKKVHLCGYSLGGRLGLCFAAKYPELIKSMFIESSTIGMEPGEEKALALENDRKISQLIKTDYQRFICKWDENVLFTNQQERNIKEYTYQQDIRSSHNNLQLSHSLLTFSKGNMPYMLHQFQKFKFPMTIINGKDDTKYIKEGRIMLKLNNNARQYIVNNASHNVHLENPESYLELLNDHLNSSL